MAERALTPLDGYFPIPAAYGAGHHRHGVGLAFRRGALGLARRGG